jgi:transcription-repair coupling factor (superfamily II helicase)
MQNLVTRMPEFLKVNRAFQEGKSPVVVTGAAGAFKAVFCSGLLRQEPLGAVLVIVPTSDQATMWQRDLEGLLAFREVLLFEPAEALPFEVVAASREPAGERLRVLASLRDRNKKPPVVIAPAEALLPKLIPAADWEQAALSFEVGKEYDVFEISRLLFQSGYQRQEVATAPGHFALRGAILDVFPFQGEPVRLEFWGDQLTSIREFSPETQCSKRSLERVVIWPAREFIYRPELVEAALSRLKEAYKKSREQLKGGRDAQTRLSQRFARLAEMASEGTGFSLHLLQPYFYPAAASLINYLPAGSLVVLDDPGRLLEQWRSVTALLESDYKRLFQEGRSFTPWQDYYFSGDELCQHLKNFPVLIFSHLLGSLAIFAPQEVVNLTVKEMQPFLGRPDLLVPEVRGWLQKKMTVLLLVQREAQKKQLEDNLREQELAASAAPEWRSTLEEGRLQIGLGSLSRGFEIPGRLAVVTERELYGKKRVRPQGRLRAAADITAFRPEFAPGDYVVHPHHGIGRYLGIKRITGEEGTRDYLEIIYAGGDRLYVPVAQADIIQKYIGPEGHVPRLSRIGGTDWARTKQRVKKKVKQLAHDLLKLYAARLTTPGFAFSPDTVWQKEFEEAFPYEETPDQLRAIAEVKADMEKPFPMDRLVCGDVGFGKTEVALRAAFKAVQDNKQVAVLVPTTVLAQQHYHTFKERFAKYPVRVEMLSRFKSPREQKMIVEAIAQGLVDIVIGTHRLLSDDVRFKDLGLLIIDEEQRFGVNHKEKIKAMKTNVDVLTLTATPIPRTLQMSLSGVRDLSLITTPPQDRIPVQTYVLEYSPEVVRDAILRELQRGGQVFYVHNRVQTIARCAAFLQRLVPEASFRIAHGQMKEEELEEVMWDFINHKFDCLVCTTIIENGLDLPNVNTLIVENADQFGLAQLYQLRGRVGRSNRLAYAYFTFEKDKVLTEQAEKRLRALQEFTEFGSGFKLALRDLEIRGAGNLLGPEQHGHVAAVGFEMFSQLLDEAVRELKGEKPPERKLDLRVWELHIDSYLPDDYIGDPAQKVEIYRRLALAKEIKEVDDLQAEVRDRFGPLPEPVLRLFTLAKLRVRSRELSVSEVEQSDHTLVFRFQEGYAPGREELLLWSKVFGKRLSFSAAGRFEVRINTKGLGSQELLGMLASVLLPA